MNTHLLASMVAVTIALAVPALAHDKAGGHGDSQAAITMPTPEAGKALLTIQADDVVLGKRDAKVTIIEYSSLSCPHCADFHNQTLERLKKDYIESGKVSFVHRDFPLNEPALRASMLAHCAGDDRYYTFLKVLFASQSKWATDRGFMSILETTAKLGGMSKETFDACMKNAALEARILNTRKEAAEKLAVKSTPTFYIGDHAIAGARSYEEFKGLIDPLLKGGAVDAKPAPATPASPKP